jgi:NADH-quinone oxidoreductase subunit I
MFSLLKSILTVFLHAFRRRDTVQYPEEKLELPPRWRGRIVLSRDPDGGERCVACHLCSAVCPVDCIALQATEDESGRRYPEFFRITFARVAGVEIAGKAKGESEREKEPVDVRGLMP